jgi:hypothetical protein
MAYGGKRMNKIGGVGGVNSNAYDEISRVQTSRDTTVSFSDVLSETLREQVTQSVMTNMGGMSGPGAMSGVFMPSAMAGMENAIVAVSEPGELSGTQLMLFMLLMMMQSGEDGGDFAPIIQMIAHMISQAGNGATGLQNNMLRLGESEPGVQRMVEIALSQVGTREQNSDGSPGSGNFTEYGAWYGMNGQPWCAMFVSWAADRAGILNDVVPRHASTSRGVSAYQERGLYSPRNTGYLPREGDAIYFQDPSTGRVNHVGIVVAYNPTTQRVYTVEGNTDNAVRIRHYDINNARIHGYGRNGGTGFGTIPGSSTSGIGANTI